RRLPCIGSAAMAVAYLRVRGRGAPSDTVAFKDELTVGRAWRADDPALQDSKMSRRHARFTLEQDGTAWVEDLGSMNGTFVNGKRIDRRQQLRLGDEVRLSATTFELVGVTAGAEETEGEARAPVAGRLPERGPAERGPAARGPAAREKPRELPAEKPPKARRQKPPKPPRPPK